jgi:hypothetical protein
MHGIEDFQIPLKALLDLFCETAPRYDGVIKIFEVWSGRLDVDDSV